MLRKTFLLPALFLVLVIVTIGAWTETAQATPPEPGCTKGAAESALQATLIGAWNVRIPKAGLGAGVFNCSVPLYEDGASFTFNSSDSIFLGYANVVPYELVGLTLAEGKALLISAEETIYFGEAGSSLEEQEIIRTAVKTAIHPDYGPVVYQGIGFVAQLEAGDYESLMVEDWLFGHYVATTNLTIQD